MVHLDVWDVKVEDDWPVITAVDMFHACVPSLKVTFIIYFVQNSICIRSWLVFLIFVLNSRLRFFPSFVCWHKMDFCFCVRFKLWIRFMTVHLGKQLIKFISKRRCLLYHINHLVKLQFHSIIHVSKDKLIVSSNIRVKCPIIHFEALQGITQHHISFFDCFLSMLQMASNKIEDLVIKHKAHRYRTLVT